MVFDLTGCCFPTAVMILLDIGQLLVENCPKIYCSVQLCKKDQNLPLSSLCYFTRSERGSFGKKANFFSLKSDLQVVPPLRRLMFLTSVLALRH